MQIKPLNDYVVIKPVKVKDTDSSGMVLSTAGEKSVEDSGTFSHGEVLAAGVCVSGVKVGDTVSVIPGKSGKDKVEYWDGIKVYCMPESAIVGIIIE